MPALAPWPTTRDREKRKEDMTIAIREVGEEFVTASGDVLLVSEPCDPKTLPAFHVKRAWPTRAKQWRCATHGPACARFPTPGAIEAMGHPTPGSEGDETDHEITYTCIVHGPEARGWEGGS